MRIIDWEGEKRAKGVRKEGKQRKTATWVSSVEFVFVGR